MIKNPHGLTPVKFPECNVALTAPSDTECHELPVFSDGNVFVCQWRATLWQRLLFLMSARKLWLVVQSDRFPPVSVSLQDTVFAKPSRSAMPKTRAAWHSGWWIVIALFIL